MMSDQPEHDQATPDRANPAAAATGPPQFPEAPLIRTSTRPAADVPAVTVGEDLSVRRKTQKAARRGGNVRPAKRRPPRSRASGWILFGACGASALLVVALLLHKLDWPASGGAASPRGRSHAENAAEAPPLPEFKPGEQPRNGASATETKPGTPARDGASATETKPDAPARDGVRPKNVRPADISRTGVRPMDAEEFTRRREGIDSFAEMGRAEAEKLHREKPKTGSPGKPETP